jgi:hypothetical protein
MIGLPLYLPGKLQTLDHEISRHLALGRMTLTRHPKRGPGHSQHLFFVDVNRTPVRLTEPMRGC